MAKIVLKSPEILVNAVDMSDHVDQVTIETSRDEVDSTAFQSAFKETLAGLGDASITMEFQQDFAAGEVDATLWPLSTSDVAFPVWIKPTTAAISATNPQYQMSCLLFNYSPLDGAVGELAKTSVTFKNASAAGLVRDVTP